MHVSGHCQDCPTRPLCLGAELDEAALEKLAARMRPSAPIARGASLYRAGDPAVGCFVVRSGAFKTTTLSAAGEEHVTQFHFPGELLGLAGQASGVHQESAVALATSTVCLVRVEDVPVLWSIGSGRSLLRLVGQAEHLGSAALVNLSRNRADARVAGFLVSVAARMRRQGRDPSRLPVPMSRTDLANYLGMTLECLSRVLSRLTRAGVIAATRTEIDVRAPRALEALASHLDA